MWDVNKLKWHVVGLGGSTKHISVSPVKGKVLYNKYATIYLKAHKSACQALFYHWVTFEGE
jgi:hypothetical protein